MLRTNPEVRMSRIQLALDVDDLEASVAFYTTLLGTGPAKRRPGYANFAISEPPLKLVLLENPGRGGGLNHLGIEVDSSEQVHTESDRLTEAGLLTDEQTGTTCCYATQDKVWATGPDGESWEVYTVLADNPEFGVSPTHLPAVEPACC
jgi:catechol 2,3-dioxygenase-like lactoylglutathione lyase family enzyme